MNMLVVCNPHFQYRYWHKVISFPVQADISKTAENAFVWKAQSVHSREKDYSGEKQA